MTYMPSCKDVTYGEFDLFRTRVFTEEFKLPSELVRQARNVLAFAQLFYYRVLTFTVRLVAVLRLIRIVTFHAECGRSSGTFVGLFANDRFLESSL